VAASGAGAAFRKNRHPRGVIILRRLAALPRRA
jgi:hypothetical protein